MRLRKPVLTFALFLLIVTPLTAALAQEESEEESEARRAGTIYRVYPLHYLDLPEGKLLLERMLPELLDDRGYSVKFEHLPRKDDSGSRPRGYLRIRTGADQHREIERILGEHDTPPRTQVFQMFLLQATDSATDYPELPAGAHQALRDLRSLLPFGGYELLDSGMMRTSHQVGTRLNPGFMVSFRYLLGPSPESPLHIDSFRLDAPDRRLMDTSFSMKRGETVVVGTSRLNGGDKALVVLLTAVE